MTICTLDANVTCILTGEREVVVSPVPWQQTTPQTRASGWQKQTGHSRCSAQPSGVGTWTGTDKVHAQSTQSYTAASSSIERTHGPANTSSQHHADTWHPSTADAAHRQARAGLRERSELKHARKARAHAHPRASQASAHTARPANHPGIMQNPGIPA